MSRRVILTLVFGFLKFLQAQIFQIWLSPIILDLAKFLKMLNFFCPLSFSYNLKKKWFLAQKKIFNTWVKYFEIYWKLAKSQDFGLGYFVFEFKKKFSYYFKKKPFFLSLTENFQHLSNLAKSQDLGLSVGWKEGSS